uniref:Uncharacterized protein n=1 Tax=Anguilla anguilla TaxID=7936 RepID=A0A0E9SNN2_ANGAN
MKQTADLAKWKCFKRKSSSKLSKLLGMLSDSSPNSPKAANQTADA